MFTEMQKRAIFIVRRMNQNQKGVVEDVPHAFALLFWNEPGFSVEAFHKACKEPVGYGPPSVVE